MKKCENHVTRKYWPRQNIEALELDNINSYVERGKVLHNRGSLGMTSPNNINMAASEDWRAPAFRQKVISQMQVLNLIA